VVELVELGAQRKARQIAITDSRHCAPGLQRFCFVVRKRRLTVSAPRWPCAWPSAPVNRLRYDSSRERTPGSPRRPCPPPGRKIAAIRATYPCRLRVGQRQRP
jgi:hypothetical protein